MNRRRFLSTSATGALSCVCGCLSPFGSDPNVRLAGVVAANYADERKSVAVRVLEGETELQSADLDLEPGDRGDDRVVGYSEPVPCEWPADPSRYVVEARLEGDRKSVAVAEDAETDCAVVHVHLDRPGWSGLTLRTADCDEFDVDDDPPCSSV